MWLLTEQIAPVEDINSLLLDGTAKRVNSQSVLSSTGLPVKPWPNKDHFNAFIVIAGFTIILYHSASFYN